MTIKNIYAVYFSPTGGTKRIVRLIADEIAKKLGLPITAIDFTLPENRQEVHHFTKEDLVILGCPVYAGRVPNKIMPDVDRLFEGEGTPAIAVSVFGNRNFDEALIETALLLTKHGFTVLAAAAAANRHAFSDKIGAGRPDDADQAEILSFAENAAAKAVGTESASMTELTELSVLSQIPGHNPPGPYYTPLGDDGQPAKFLKAKPVVDAGKCTGCMACAHVCPVGSIDESDVTVTSGICIKCQACIRTCPVHARTIEDERFLSHVRMLEKNYERRAENSFYL